MAEKCDFLTRRADFLKIAYFDDLCYLSSWNYNNQIFSVYKAKLQIQLI